MSTCVLVPNKGAKEFKQMVKIFGRPVAASIYNIVISDKFQKEYKESLVDNGEGFPTLSSILGNPAIQHLLGKDAVAQLHEASFKQMNDTLDNAPIAIEEAANFNASHNAFVAIVESKDGKLVTKVYPRNEATAQQAQAQKKILETNKRLATILNRAGVTISILSKIERGIPGIGQRFGMTNFNHLKNVVGDFTELIKVANGLQGYCAIGEEAAHLLIGTNKGNPLVYRAITMAKDEAVAREILGDEYDAVAKSYAGDVDMIAEEAIGKVLRDKLEGKESKQSSLLDRMVNFIKGLFKGIDHNDVTAVVNDINKAMGSFADTAMKDANVLTREKIKEAESDKVFNQLDSMARSIEEAMQEIKVDQIKLTQRMQNVSKAALAQADDEAALSNAKAAMFEQSKVINNLLKDDQDLPHKIIGLVKTMQQLSSEVDYMKNLLGRINSMSLKDKFITLRNAFMVAQSASKTHNLIRTLLANEEVVKELDVFKEKNPEIIAKIKEYDKATADMLDDYGSDVLNAAKPLFMAFIEQSTGKTEFKLYVKNDKGEKEAQMVDVKYIIEHMNDNGFWSRYMTTMSDNPEIMLRIYDQIVSKAKTAKRIKVRKLCEQIRSIGLKAKQAGIKSFDQFFEADKANYVMPQSYKDDTGQVIAHDRAKYDAAKKAARKELFEKHGSPARNTSEYKQFYEDYRKWMAENTLRVSIAGKERSVPNPRIYPSASAKFTAAENEFYEEWLKIKAKCEDMLGENAQGVYGTIKIKKTGIERLQSEGLQQLYGDVKDDLRHALEFDFDEDSSDGNEINLDFNGKEMMVMKPNYTKCPKDRLHLITTDMVGSLQAYVEMAANIDAMQEIANPLEIGVSIFEKENVTKGGAIERITAKGVNETRQAEISWSESKLAGRMMDFLASQVYNVHTANDLPDRAKKGVAHLLKLGSQIQMGFNALAQTINPVTGTAMQLIEANAGQFFNFRELRKADAQVVKLMTEKLRGIATEAPVSKLDAIDEVFNVRMDLDSKRRHATSNTYNMLYKIFGPSIAYLGQDVGDDYMYHKAFMAIMMHEKTDQDKNVSLYDIMDFELINEDNPKEGIRLKFKEGYTYHGKAISADNAEFITLINNRHEYVNRHTMGVYDDDGQIAARRYVAGRLFMQYRDWLPAQLQYRFGELRHDEKLDEDVEGYYVTMGRVIKTLYNEVKNGEANIPKLWSEMRKDPLVLQNTNRVLWEIGQYALIALAAGLILKGGGDDDDDEETWFKNFLKYIIIREKTELAVLTPASGPAIFKEYGNIIKSPLACSSVLEKGYNLSCALWIPSWFEEVESGDYKGHSEGYKYLMKSPAVLWWGNVKRATNPKKAINAFK